jgi:hypothetical protein
MQKSYHFSLCKTKKAEQCCLPKNWINPKYTFEFLSQTQIKYSEIIANPAAAKLTKSLLSWNL